jgi:hypothetical protein
MNEIRSVISRPYLDIEMPRKLVDKSQAYFWTRKWQEGERAANEDIKAGRVKTFEPVGELIKDLDQK